MFVDVHWPLVSMPVLMLVIIPQLNAPLVSLNTAKGPFVNRSIWHAHISHFICVMNMVYYSFVMLGNVPKSNWAGMITEESGDGDKWSSTAQCTVRVHQPWAAGVSFSRRIDGENKSGICPLLHFLCLFCRAERQRQRGSLCKHTPTGGAAAGSRLNHRVEKRWIYKQNVTKLK